MYRLLGHRASDVFSNWKGPARGHLMTRSFATADRLRMVATSGRGSGVVGYNVQVMDPQDAVIRSGLPVELRGARGRFLPSPQVPPACPGIPPFRGSTQRTRRPPTRPNEGSARRGE